MIQSDLQRVVLTFFDVIYYFTTFTIHSVFTVYVYMVFL